MDTEALRLFVLAADLLNISAAGRRLGLSPAVAGSKLAKLEYQLRTDLLHRSTRKVAVSQDGAAFLPYAREILAQEDAALAALGHSSPDIHGTIRFAASSTFAQLYIAPILPEFLARYPKIDVDLKFSDAQLNLIEGGFDLALRNYAIEDSGLVGRKLADDKRVLCASPGYVAQHGTPATPADLVDHQLLVFQGVGVRKLAKAGAPIDDSFPPKASRSRVICDDGASMRIAAKAGVGICMSSLWNIHTDLEDGSLVRVLPEYELDDQSAIWLVYPKSNVLTAKTRALIDFLLEKIRL